MNQQLEPRLDLLDEDQKWDLLDSLEIPAQDAEEILRAPKLSEAIEKVQGKLGISDARITKALDRLLGATAVQQETWESVLARSKNLRLELFIELCEELGLRTDVFPSELSLAMRTVEFGKLALAFEPTWETDPTVALAAIRKVASHHGKRKDTSHPHRTAHPCADSCGKAILEQTSMLRETAQNILAIMQGPVYCDKIP